MSSTAHVHPGDVAAVWEVRLGDGIHTVLFEHGTTSGKRVIIVDGVEVCECVCGCVEVWGDVCVGVGGCMGCGHTILCV